MGRCLHHRGPNPVLSSRAAVSSPWQGGGWGSEGGTVTGVDIEEVHRRWTGEGDRAAPELVVVDLALPGIVAVGSNCPNLMATDRPAWGCQEETVLRRQHWGDEKEVVTDASRGRHSWRRWMQRGGGTLRERERWRDKVMCQLKNGVAYRLVSSIPFEVSVSLRNRHQYPTYECRFFFWNMYKYYWCCFLINRQL